MKARTSFVLGALAVFAKLLLSCSPQRGAVTFYDNIPPPCQTVRGLKQKKVIQVYSEEQLRKHYGLSFRVRFNDGVSPQLYGVLYYQNKKQNLYCMALPDGRFAMFRDSRIDRHRTNMIQELCYPIQEC